MFHVLIFNGFRCEEVCEMSYPLFTIHFLSALKCITRARQMQSANLISTVGSLFVKQGEKTIVEQLMQELHAIDEMMGERVVKPDKKKDKAKRGRDAFNFLLNNIEKFKKR